MTEEQNSDSALAGEFARYVIMNILSMIGMSICILTACFVSGRLAVFPGADGTTFANTEVYLKVILLFSPAFVNEMASGIVMFVFNFLILRLEGNDGAAAYGILANILIVILAVYNGLAQGSQPVFGLRFRRRKT